MACNNCFDNCLKGITLDTCVRYTGADNSTLNILSGDSLYSVLNTLISTLSDEANPTYIAACTFLSDILGSTGSVTQQQMVNALNTAMCSLKEDVTALQCEVDAPIAFDTDCLGVASDATLAQILQAAFTKICSNSTAITTISSDYVKASQLCTLVTQCISSSASTQEYTKMPKYVALPYHGPTTVFDSNGKGYSASGYDKVYMCLGQTVNGFTLPDYRGRSPIGANSGILVAGMDSVVNPALTPNAGYAITNKQKIGGYTDTLSSTQIPTHTHTVNDSGHYHNSVIANSGNNEGTLSGSNSVNQSKDNGQTNGYILSGAYSIPNAGRTSTNTTGITINPSVGGGQAHNTTHPSVGAIFIMYIP
jgi:microcystin-dependent protein